MDDILVVLDPQKYVELLETLKEGMPATFYMTYIVTNIIDWNNLKEKKGLDWYKNVSELVPRSASILVPRTGFQNATFFVVDEYKKNHHYNLSFFTLQKNGEELAKCLNETKLIPWTVNPMFNAVLPGQLKLIEQVSKKNNLKLEHNICLNYYKLSKHKVGSLPEITLPVGYSLVDLIPDADSKIVNEWWPHKSANSVLFVKFILCMNGGFGIKNDDGVLVASILRSELLSCGLIHVIEAESKRGFAQALILHYCREFVRKFDMDPTTFILSENLQSIALFQKLGYEFVGTLDRYNTISEIALC